MCTLEIEARTADTRIDARRVATGVRSPISQFFETVGSQKRPVTARGAGVGASSARAEAPTTWPGVPT